MEWEEAKRRTIELWTGIHDSVGEASEVELLTDINAITDFCTLAKHEAGEHGDLDKCHFCPAYQQFGGCREVCAELSDLVVQEEYDEVRRHIRDFIATLEKVEVPS